MKAYRGTAVIIAASVVTGALTAVQTRAVGDGPAGKPRAVGKRWAAIVGVNDYQDIPKLRYCVADARLLYKTLHERAGFSKDRMILLTDTAARFSDMPTRKNIYRRLSDLLSFASPEDTVLVFFSGHGLRDDQGRGYFAPIDADATSLVRTCVAMAQVKQLIESCKARSKVLMLDTCHAGTAKGGPVDKRIAIGSAELVQQAAGKGFVTLASCGPKQESHESAKLGHGVFSHYLAEGLQGRADRDHDGWVDFDELYRYAWDKTRVHVWKEFRRKQEPLKDVRFQGVMLLGKAVHRPGAGRTLIVPDHYGTIQQAIHAANPGDTVMVKPGVYREQITFKDGVRLLGTERGLCRVEVADGAKHILKATKCKTGTIESLTFDGRDVRIKTPEGGQYPHGVVLADSRLTVRDCVVQNCFGCGIVVTGPDSAPTLAKNTCRNNERHGISFEWGAGGTAEGNTCERNTRSGIASFQSGTAPTLRNNTCRNNGTNGIYFGNGAGGTAEGNTCEGNKCGGIASFDSGTAPTLKSNTCRNNDENGIYFGDGAGGTADGNTCEANKWSGIASLDSGTAPTLKNNTCRNNEDCGIYFGKGAGGTAEGNTCEGNASCGILADGDGTNPTLRGNQCNDNNRSGIWYQNGAKPRLDANTATGNREENIGHD